MGYILREVISEHLGVGGVAEQYNDPNNTKTSVPVRIPQNPRVNFARLTFIFVRNDR
jgi:hypothetical protein